MKTIKYIIAFFKKPLPYSIYGSGHSYNKQLKDMKWRYFC
jgi:hypothetical protein